MSTEQTVRIPSYKRPLSIWVLAIANGLLAIVLIGASLTASHFGYTTGQAVFMGIVGLGVSVSAHMTWFGKRYGRNLLIGLLTVFLGLLLVQSIRTIAWAIDVDYEGVLLSQSVAWAVFSVLWLAVNYWLLFGRRARAFYA
jgi:hypothetical protein